MISVIFIGLGYVAFVSTVGPIALVLIVLHLLLMAGCTRPMGRKAKK